MPEVKGKASWKTARQREARRGRDSDVLRLVRVWGEPGETGGRFSNAFERLGRTIHVYHSFYHLDHRNENLVRIVTCIPSYARFPFRYCIQMR